MPMLSTSTLMFFFTIISPMAQYGKRLHDDADWTEICYEQSIGYVASRYLSEDPDWKSHIQTKNGYKNGEAVSLNVGWRYADFSAINSGHAVMYTAFTDRKNIIVGVNAGHGTKGGTSVKTWCHPDKTAKVTGGSTAADAQKAAAVSSGMSFRDGSSESSVTLREAILVRDFLLQEGYDVMMLRDGDDVKLDNIARTVICNNVADCHIAIHWDGDGLDYDKGCFYMSVEDGIKYLDSVATAFLCSYAWQRIF